MARNARRPPGPVAGRHLDAGQVVVEAPLALADVQEVGDAGRPLLAPGVDEDQAAFLLAVDEQVLGDDDALAEGLGRGVPRVL